MKKHIGLLLTLALLVSFPQTTLSQTTPKAWTYLVYMAGDNNLDSAGDYSLNLLKSGLKPDANINVVALYDHYNAPAELLQVTPNAVTKLQDYGEPDTADPATLEAFLSWGISTFPAEHYAVVAWSHGGGWKYIFVDSSSGNRMSIDGFATALTHASASLGRKIDVTIFDACLMSMVEVAYQLADATDNVVASEESVPAAGFPYDKMIARLVKNPNVDPMLYARGIADDYYDFYNQTNSKSALSVTATRENQLDPLIKAIDKVTLTLLSNPKKFNSAIGGARSVSQHQIWGTNGVFWYVDLQVFFEQLSKKANNSLVTSQSTAVINAMKEAVYERHGANLNGTINGLGINFPPNLTKYTDKSYLAQNYQDINLRFTRDTHWDEMILASYN